MDFRELADLETGDIQPLKASHFLKNEALRKTVPGSKGGPFID